MASKLSCTEIEDMPEEVLIEIWSHLDFDTVQKTCTRVSKSWLGMIRNSKLSWKMKLRDTRLGLLGVTDFNAILSQWEDLRELHFSSKQDFAKFRLSLNSNKPEPLEKIVIPSMIEFETEWTINDVVHFSVARVTKYWIDPKHLLTPLDEIKNVIELTMSGRASEIPEEFAMRQNDCDFTNLENLKINYHYPKWNVGNCGKFIPMLSRFKELKNLETVPFNIVINIDYLLDFLRFLGDRKNLTISVSFLVKSELDEEATKDIFSKALEILREKFPFPDARILKLAIKKYPSSKSQNIWEIFVENGAIYENFFWHYANL